MLSITAYNCKDIMIPLFIYNSSLGIVSTATPDGEHGTTLIGTSLFTTRKFNTARVHRALKLWKLESCDVIKHSQNVLFEALFKSGLFTTQSKRLTSLSMALQTTIRSQNHSQFSRSSAATQPSCQRTACQPHCFQEVEKWM